MGGVVPTGYDVVDRKLVIVPDDAKLVQRLFERYVELGSVTLLAVEMEAQGHRTPMRISRAGRTYGASKFSRGMVYNPLRNRTYIGEVCHKGSNHAGEHEQIIERALFEKASELLKTNASDRVMGTTFDNPSLLAGIIWHVGGHRLTPSHSVKRGKRYRYYIEEVAGVATGQRPLRIPAGDIEGLVMAQLRSRTDDAAREIGEFPVCTKVEMFDRALALAGVERVEVAPDNVSIRFRPIYGQPAIDVTIPAKLFRSGKEMKLAIPPEHGDTKSERDPALIQFVVRAHMARAALEQSSDMTIEQLASQQSYSRDYYVVLLRIAYLAPDITAAILDGRQPLHLSRQRLARTASLPMDWQGQREALGFA